MVSVTKAWRALLVGEAEPLEPLQALFREAPLMHWQPCEAHTIEQARFYVQMQACDAVIVDASISTTESLCSLRWLTERTDVPVLFVSSANGDVIEQALCMGAHQWLPREAVLQQSSLLATCLEQTLQLRAKSKPPHRAQEQLAECRQQVARLVNLLWELTPIQGKPRWFSQRYVMGRLHEEVQRNNRHGQPLSVALGHVWMEDAPREGDDNPVVELRRYESNPLSALTAERITRTKRRSDVAGQYGMDGFMLLLPATERNGAERCCRRIKSAFEDTPYQSSASGPAMPISVSMGIAAVTSETMSAKTLLRRAEQQLEIACTSA